ncbi:Uncharacterised protein [Mycobacteroides abscessus subsp. abscessus]|nr:Uncharacterised protein [Mycobacteroides abscessus subsp. abscessus]
MATLASRTLNCASALASRMSAAAMRSTPPPMHQPDTAAITGLEHSATELIEACSLRISLRKSVRGAASARSAISGPKVPDMAGRSRP